MFCASLADVFDNEVDWEWRDDLFDLIRQTPNLDWLLLTKRIGNVLPMIEEMGRELTGLYPNIWLGATIVAIWIVLLLIGALVLVRGVIGGYLQVRNENRNDDES